MGGSWCLVTHGYISIVVGTSTLFCVVCPSLSSALNCAIAAHVGSTTRETWLGDPGLESMPPAKRRRKNAVFVHLRLGDKMVSIYVLQVWYLVVDIANLQLVVAHWGHEYREHATQTTYIRQKDIQNTITAFWQGQVLQSWLPSAPLGGWVWRAEWWHLPRPPPFYMRPGQGYLCEPEHVSPGQSLPREPFLHCQ